MLVFHSTSMVVQTVSQVFPAHKQACTSFTGPTQRSKLLSQPFLLLKQAWKCFTSPARRCTRLCKVFPTYKQACISFTGPTEWWKLLSSSLLTLEQAKKELEGSFHHCGDPVKLMQACLWVGKTLQSRANRRAGDEKHVQACLSTKKD